MNNKTENQLDDLVDEIKYDYDNNLTSDKIFFIFAMTSLFANIVGAISNAIIFGFSYTTIFCIVFSSLILISLLSLKIFKKPMYYNIVVVCLIIFVEFPVLYLSYREASVPYFVLGIYASIVLFSKRTRYFVGLGLFITYFLTVSLGFFYSDIYDEFIDSDPNRINLYASLFVSTIVTITTILISLNVIKNNSEKFYNEYKEMTRKIERVNHYDPLVPCYNRKYATDYLSNLSTSLAFGGVTLILCDLIDMNNVNEKYGFQTGDDLLVNFASISFKVLKGRGFIARFGGVKFLIVLNNVTIESEINKIVNEIISEFNAYYSKNRNDKFRIGYGISILKNNFNPDDEIKILTLSCHANSKNI